MPPKGKQKGKTAKVASGQPSSTTASSPSSANQPPAPYQLAPARLEPFLSQLSKYHVYITHIDRKPVEHKWKIFLVPVAFNAAIIAALLWRLSVVGPWYVSIGMSLMGRGAGAPLALADTRQMGFGDARNEMLRRAGTFLLDFLLYVFIWPWPRDFVGGLKIGNPVAWRLAVRFRPDEIIVRRSRRWIEGIGNILDDDAPGKKRMLGQVRTATEPLWMHEKTGYLMLNNAWDLEWRLMIKATAYADRGPLTLDDFRTAAYVYASAYGWMTIDLGVAAGSTKEEAGRRKIVAFKDELTAMGKENLFFRWIELVQFESTQPGGFGPARQQSTMTKAREMFEAQGVDFDKFWDKIGGMAGLPGMDHI